MLNSALFCYFVAVLVWAPLPLASNREWSTQLLAGLLLLGLASALPMIVAGLLPVTAALRRAWPAVVALLGVQLWVGLQLALGISVNPPATELALQQGCGLTSAFVLVLVLLDSPERITFFTRVMVLCGVFQAFFAALMMLGDVQSIAVLDKVFDRGGASGTFINKNHLAGFLEMNLAVGIGMLLAQLHRYPAANWREFWRRTVDTILSRKFRLRVYLAIMVIGLVLTRSRMGNTAFFSSLLVCGCLGLVLQGRITRGAIVFFVSMLLIDLYIVGNWFGVDKVVAHIQQTTFETEMRDDVARDTLALWLDNFWLGTGADTFGWAYYYGGYVSEGLPFHRQAHNDYLEIGATFGFIGLALLVVVVVVSLWQALQAQRQRRSRLMQGLGFASTMGVVSILIHSLADFNLHIPANSLWFVVLLALAWVARYGTSSPHTY
jgi:O-antigen ligase